MVRRSERQMPGEFSKQLAKLTIAGGLGFWVANVAISLTPIAAEYRAALSIMVFAVWLLARGFNSPEVTRTRLETAR